MMPDEKDAMLNYAYAMWLAFWFILTLVVCGCATRIETPGLHFVTYGDSATIKLDGPNGLHFYATNLRHSPATRAAFTGASHLVTSAGTAALPFVTGVPVAARLAPVVPASIPHFRATPELRP